MEYPTMEELSLAILGQKEYTKNPENSMFSGPWFQFMEKYNFGNNKYMSEYIIKLLKEREKQIKRTEKKQYAYMITFTRDYKKNNDTDEKFKEFILKTLNNRKETLQLIECEYTIEGGDEVNKHYHIHVAVISTKTLKKDNFRYVSGKYGYVDVSQSKMAKTCDEMLNYMSKQTQPIKLF